MSSFSQAPKSRKSIEVLAIKPIQNTRNLRAFASVRIGDITIHDLRIIQQEKQKAWVSLPQREYVNSDGQRRFSAVIEVSEELKRVVSDAVLTAWEQGGAV
jgi:DNA-binding cell septation regulator SpoVG